MAGISLAQGISLPPEGRFTFRREQKALFCSDFCHKSAIYEQKVLFCSFPGLQHAISEQNAPFCSLSGNPGWKMRTAANDAAVLEDYGFPKDASESETLARLFKMYQELTEKK